MMIVASSSRPSVSALSDAALAVWVSLAFLAAKPSVPFVILDRPELGILPADAVRPLFRDGLALVSGPGGSVELPLDGEVRVVFS